MFVSAKLLLTVVSGTLLTPTIIVPVAVEVLLRAGTPSKVELTGVPLVIVPLPETEVPLDEPLNLKGSEDEFKNRLVNAAFTGKETFTGAATGLGILAVSPPPPPPQAANVAIALVANNNFKILYMISLSIGKPTRDCALWLFN